MNRSRWDPDARAVGANITSRRAGSDIYPRPLQEGAVDQGEAGVGSTFQPPCAIAPRFPRESASSKNTITPPYRVASLRSLRYRPFTLRIPTPKNIALNAPGSTKTNGFADSPATACAMRVLPVPGGPHRRIPPGT